MNPANSGTPPKNAGVPLCQRSERGLDTQPRFLHTSIVKSTSGVVTAKADRNASMAWPLMLSCKCCKECMKDGRLANLRARGKPKGWRLLLYVLEGEPCCWQLHVRFAEGSWWAHIRLRRECG